MSFFGFDTSKPQKPKKPKAQDYDEFLENKFKYSADQEDIKGVLDEDDDELNDETFAEADTSKIGKFIIIQGPTLTFLLLVIWVRQHRITIQCHDLVHRKHL
jgi:hypothetical protein